MEQTVVLGGQEDAGTVGAYYGRMLALAERITGIHLGPDFLNRPSMVVGWAGDVDEGSSYEVVYEPWRPSVGRGRSDEQLLGDIPWSLRMELREPLARRACQAAGIAHLEPFRSALDALREYQLMPATMSGLQDVLTAVQSDPGAFGDAGHGAPAADARESAIRALFVAFEPESSMNLGPLLELTKAATGLRGEDLIRDVCGERGYG
jgi:hypothetical protein